MESKKGLLKEIYGLQKEVNSELMALINNLIEMGLSRDEIFQNKDYLVLCAKSEAYSEVFEMVRRSVRELESIVRAMTDI